MRISTDIMAFDAYRDLDTTGHRRASGVEQLSSSYRVDRRAAVTSGPVVSRTLEEEVSGLASATRDARDRLAAVRAGEAELTRVGSMLRRIRDLIAYSADAASSNGAAGSAAQHEIAQLRDEINRITGGTNTACTALAGIDATNTTRNGISVSLVDAAIDSVSARRRHLAADRNRFEATVANLQVATANLSASWSRIRDTGTAAEMVSYIRDQILLQSGTATVAQANSAPQTILRLLQ